MRDQVSAETLLEAIENGWFPTWFAVEADDEGFSLDIDLCCNWRLTDGKARFFRVDLDGHPSPRLLVTTIADLARTQWDKAITECQQNSHKDIIDHLHTEKPSKEYPVGTERDEAIWKKLQLVVAEVLGVAPQYVERGTDIIDDLGADSLDRIEIVMAIEDEFEIELDDDTVEPWKTPDDAYQFLIKLPSVVI